MPLTSIIITTHDRPQLLRRAVASAHAAGKDIEVVVVDDASSDETERVCQTLPGINYQRLDRNQGVAGARNVGLLVSSGDYVTFLDDDDVRLPGSLDSQVNLLEANERAGLVYGQAIYGNQSGKPTDDLYPLAGPEGDVFWQLLAQNFIPCGSAVFRRSCLNTVGLLDDSLPGLDDWDLWLRIAELFSVIATEQPVMIWRRSTPVSGQGTSQAVDLASHTVRQFHRVWLKLPRAASASSQTRRAAWRKFSANVAEHLVWEAVRSLQHARIGAAARNMFALLRLCPGASVRLASSSNFLRLWRRIKHDARTHDTGDSDSIDRTSLQKDRAGAEENLCG